MKSALYPVLAVLHLATLAALASASSAPAVHDFESGDNFIREWVVVGPFPNPSLDQPDAKGYTRGGFGTDYLDGEATAILEAGRTYPSPDGACLEAIALSADDDGGLRLGKLLGQIPNRVAYAFAWIEADVPTLAHVFVGFDDGGRIYINGEEVLDSFVPGGRGLRPRQSFFSVKLKRGLNPVLVKLDQVAGDWGVIMEVLSTEEIAPIAREQANLALEAGPSQMESPDVWKTPLTLALSFDASVFPDVVVDYKAVGIDGTIIATNHGKAGDTVLLTTPPGAWEVTGHCVLTTPAGPRELYNQTWILADSNPVAYSKETLHSLGRLPSEWPDETMLNNPYAGWKQFVSERLQELLNRPPARLREQGRRTFQLQQVARMEQEGPSALRSRTGAFEWAYLSRVDGSAQPFAVRVPSPVDAQPIPENGWPVEINMHGAGGDHGSEWGDPQTRPWLEMYPNGRGRFGGYYGLSEVDVLEATQFVLQHLAVDPDRVVLSGGSMGGFGTFRIGARYPDRWAALVPWCGGGMHMPAGNFINTPIFALHSDDDLLVPVGLARAAVEAINEEGGQAYLAESTGYGHGIGQWREGKRRMERWIENLSRPIAENQARVSFETRDGAVSGAWWARIVKFADVASAARVDARFGNGNNLYIDLENVAIIRLDLADSPADRQTPLTVNINGREQMVLDPVPAVAWFAISENEEARRITEAEEPDRSTAYHTPAGMPALYRGEPLAIVYGTQGDSATVEAMRNYALTGSRCSNAAWHDDAWRHMSFGQIPVMPDTDVTESVLNRFNLILIGTAKENSLVAQLADQLPVQFAEGKIRCSDGSEWTAEDRGLNLVFPNPAQSTRLISWIAGARSFYSTGNLLHRMLNYEDSAPDLVVVDAVNPKIVASRFFDAEWQWRAQDQLSPLLDADKCSLEAMSLSFAHSLADAAGADYAITRTLDGFGEMMFAPGETRVADLLAWIQHWPVATVELTPEELRLFEQAVSKEPERFGSIRLVSRAEKSSTPENSVMVALIGWDIHSVLNALGYCPRSFRKLNVPFAEHVARNAAQQQ